MKRIISILFIAVFSIPLTLAQDAKSILDQVASKSKSYKTMKGDFQYTLQNKAANVFENSNGSFMIKGDKYFIDILGTETYFDGEHIYSFIKDVNEVSIQSPDNEDDDFLKPSNLFTMYQKGYSCKYVGQLVEKGKTLHIIDLFPKEDNKNYKKLIVKIDSKTNNLVSMKSIGKSGDDVEIIISSMQTNTAIKDNKFKFNKSEHPNIEIIDMR